MCIEVIINGKYLSTKGELRNALGFEPVTDQSFAWPDECCLCPCDIEKTAENAHMDVTWNDSMECEFKPKEQS